MFPCLVAAFFRVPRPLNVGYSDPMQCNRPRSIRKIPINRQFLVPTYFITPSNLLLRTKAIVTVRASDDFEPSPQHLTKIKCRQSVNSDKARCCNTEPYLRWEKENSHPPVPLRGHYTTSHLFRLFILHYIRRQCVHFFHKN